MNFKYLLLAFAISLSGCTDFLKGKKTTDHVITIEENEACLQHFPTVFDKFLDSKIVGAEIDEALGCLNSTLTRFQNKFRGQQEKDVFSIDDITTIFNFFFKDLKISRDTSEKLVRFKFALIGGNANTLSKVDVENLKEFLKALSSELKNISKWVAVFRSDNGKVPESSIKSAYGQLRSSLINLINSGHISKTQYSIEDFLMLLKQFNFNLKPYSEQIEQLLIVKKFLIGDDYVKSKESYIAAIELILEIMQLNAMIENQHYKFDLKKPETQKSLSDLIQAALQIIKNSPRMKSEHSLQLQMVKELVKFESPLLSFENLLTIKTIVFGGQKETLTISEINGFEMHQDIIIGSAYKAIRLLEIKSLEQFVLASPELQSEIKKLFESTSLEAFLAKSDYSKKIFEALRDILKSQGNIDIQNVNSVELFSQIADEGSFASKENILKFLKSITELLNLTLHQQKSEAAISVTARLKQAAGIISSLQDVLSLKNDPILSVAMLVKNAGFADDKINEAQGIITIQFTKMNLEQACIDDLQKIQDVLRVAGNEFQYFSKIPQTAAEFESVKKALKPILAATDFYQGRFKTHDVISLIVKLASNEFGDPKAITEILNRLVVNREIYGFEDINSVLNSAFGAYQISKKVSGTDSKLSLSLVQDFIGMILDSDTMRTDKKLDINQLIKTFQAVPQAARAIPQMTLGLKYLKVLFPQISDGIADEATLRKLMALVNVFEKQKKHLLHWPTTDEETKLLKLAIEVVLAHTDFYAKPMKSHALLNLLLDAALQNSTQIQDLIGQNKQLLSSYIKLLIADQDVKSMLVINSILDSVFDGINFYKKYSESDKVFDIPFIQKVVQLLQDSDHMRVLGYIRLDLAVVLLTQIDVSLMKNLNISEADILALKVNFFGGSMTQFTLADVNSLKQLIRLFVNNSNLSIKSTDPKRIVKFFTNTESIKAFYNIFYRGQQNLKGPALTLAGMSGQLMALMKGFIKVQSEFEVAKDSKEFSLLSKQALLLVDELLALPTFEKAGTLDLNELKTVLKASLDLDIPISDNILDFKRILLGGSAFQINRHDLISAKKLIQFMTKNQTEIKNDLFILLLDRNPSYTMEQINKAAVNIKEKMAQFIQLSQLTKAGLTLDVFIKKIEPILKMFSFKIDLSLITTGHHLLVGSYFDYSAQHFKALVNTYVDVLRVMRFGQLGFVKLEIKERNQFLLTMHALDTLFEVFENSIAFQKGRRFDTQYFDAFLAVLLKKEIIPYQVSPELFASFYKKMVNTVFSRPRVASDELPFITEQHFIGLKNEMILFKFFIHVLDAAFTETDYKRENVAVMNAKLKTSIELQFTKFEGLYETAFAHSPAFFKKALKLYKDEILQKKPIVFSNGYVISHNQIDYFSGWADQMRAHYIRTLARLLMQGWGMGDETEINSKGLVRWYADFKDFSVAIKTFDPRSTNSGEQSMLEANLFTFSGNGDKKLNFSEATQYISLLMTGGGSHFNRAYALAKKHGCLIADQTDVVGFNYVAEPCMVGVYTQNFESLFSNLNWFVKYLKNLKSNGDRYLFFESVMEVARNPQNKTPHLESIELKTMNMLIMYMESVFSVLDKNQNSTLSPDEIRHRESYKRFESLVYSVAEKNSGKLLKAFAEDKMKAICRTKDNPEDNKRYLAREAFIYLIYNGHLPKEKDFFSWSGFSDTIGTAWNCGWNEPIFKFEGEVDRKMMINTFKLLKTVLPSQ